MVSCSGNPNTSGAKFKPNTFSSTVQADITDINASYHSLQTSVEKRMFHGFTVLANYTYSKSLDDLPFGEGVSGFDTGYSTLPFNAPGRHKFDYGPSGFDHTHVFTGSYVWHSPRVKSSSTLLRNLLGDYEIGGIVSAVSGRPITVLQGTEISGTGIGQDRGTYISGVDPYSSGSCAGVTAKCVSWLTPAAFQPTKVTTGCPPLATSCNNPAIFGTFGNVGKNGLRLPRTSNWDVQLSKYFNFTERWKLQIRAEYFNVLNHPNFAPESISTGPVNGTERLAHPARERRELLVAGAGDQPHWSTHPGEHVPVAGLRAGAKLAQGAREPARSVGEPLGAKLRRERPERGQGRMLLPAESCKKS